MKHGDYKTSKTSTVVQDDKQVCKSCGSENFTIKSFGDIVCAECNGVIGSLNEKFNCTESVELYEVTHSTVIAGKVLNLPPYSVNQRLRKANVKLGNSGKRGGGLGTKEQNAELIKELNAMGLTDLEIKAQTGLALSTVQRLRLEQGLLTPQQRQGKRVKK